MYDYNVKLAKLTVNYAENVQPGEIVLIQGSEVANDLIREIYIEVIKAGGHPVVISQVKGLSVAKYRLGNVDQLKFVDPIMKIGVEIIHHFINILADNNVKKMSLIPSENQTKVYENPEFMEMMKKYQERVAKKELGWVIVPYPCDSLAQEANMDLASYKEFVYTALHLDSDDPASTWQKIKTEQDRLVEILNKADTIQVLGDDTDLTLRVKDRPWVNCCGKNNLPDGELYTSPLEDSINGHIRFTYPGIYQGKEIENIYLEFKNGQVVQGTAEKGQELLDSILKIKNANKIGEFALGTNYGISKFTKSMLFDEKMGGTLHMALGKGFPDSKSENQECAIHWDILKDMKSENSKVIVDGKIIYQAGKWLI